MAVMADEIDLSISFALAAISVFVYSARFLLLIWLYVGLCEIIDAFPANIEILLIVFEL